MHIQNSTFAGGISISTVAGILRYPHHAIIIGAITGFLSVIGHVFLTVLFIITFYTYYVNF